MIRFIFSQQFFLLGRLMAIKIFMVLEHHNFLSSSGFWMSLAHNFGNYFVLHRKKRIEKDQEQLITMGKMKLYLFESGKYIGATGDASS